MFFLQALTEPLSSTYSLLSYKNEQDEEDIEKGPLQPLSSPQGTPEEKWVAAREIARAHLNEDGVNLEMSRRFYAFGASLITYTSVFLIAGGICESDPNYLGIHLLSTSCATVARLIGRVATPAIINYRITQYLRSQNHEMPASLRPSLCGRLRKVFANNS